MGVQQRTQTRESIFRQVRKPLGILHICLNLMESKCSFPHTLQTCPFQVQCEGQMIISYAFTTFSIAAPSRNNFASANGSHSAVMPQVGVSVGKVRPHNPIRFPMRVLRNVSRFSLIKYHDPRADGLCQVANWGPSAPTPRHIRPSLQDKHLAIAATPASFQ